MTIRILIYDNNLNDLELLFNMINSMPIDTIVDKVCEYDDFVAIYNKHTYENIFIDFSDDIGMNITLYLQTSNKNQKMVLITDKFRCFENLSCKQCKDTYNANVLIKPITQNQVIQVISNQFECESFEKDESTFLIQKIKKTILADHPYIQYDEQNQSFLLNEISDSIQIPALVDITELLNQNKIEYDVFDNDRVSLKG